MTTKLVIYKKLFTKNTTKKLTIKHHQETHICSSQAAVTAGTKLFTILPYRVSRPTMGEIKWPLQV